jgi:hypothetical protein
MLGRWGTGQDRAPDTASALAEALRRYDIGAALVHYAIAARNSPRVGNARLLAEIAGFPQLAPCWVLLPDATGEFPSPDETMSAMQAANVRAALLAPRTYRLALREWGVGPLLERLAARCIPTFVDFGVFSWSSEAMDWGGLLEIGQSFPDLPLILVRANIGSDRQLFPLLEQLPNLHIETSYYTVHRGIELICRQFGARRAFFGTSMPYRNPGPAITALMYARISATERALVGGGNLRRLLEEVRW